MNTRLNDNYTVSMSRKEYERLKRRDDFLAALEGAGVDNWEGYSYACEIFEDEDADNN